MPNLSDIDLRLLRVFSQVVWAGGFTAAELSLNKSKSSISMDISALETRLGVKLCNRGRGGFALTPEGLKIYDHIKGLFLDIDRFQEAVGAVAGQVSGAFSIVTDDDNVVTHSHLLTAALAEFNDICPEVFVGLDGVSALEVVNRVRAGAADFGLTALPQRAPALQIEPVFLEEMALYCASSHPLHDVPDEDLSIDRLHEQPMVDMRTRLDERIAAFLDGANICARAPTMQARLLLISTGRYLGFLPVGYVAQMAGERALREVRPDIFRHNMQVYLVTRNEAAAERKIGLFRPILIKWIEKAGPQSSEFQSTC